MKISCQRNTLLISISIAFFICFCQQSNATNIYTTTFGTTDYSNPPNWSFTGVNINISSNTNSSGGYTGASGGDYLGEGNSATFTNTSGAVQSGGTVSTGTSTATLTTSTSGYTNIIISFGMRKSSSSYGATVTLQWSTDDMNWNNISYSEPSAGNWGLATGISALPTGAENQSTLYLKWTFVRTTLTGNYKIDDFTVTGNPPNPPTSFAFTCPSTPTSNTLVISWVAPSGSYTGVLVFGRAGSATTYVPSGNGSGLTGANSAFSSATTYGTDKLVYSGTGTTVTITGLTAGTTYYFDAYSYLSAVSVYSAATATINSVPLVPDVTGASVTSNNSQLTINWTSPSCFDQIMVVGTSNSSVTSTPSGNGSSYSANQLFATSPSGTNLNSGEYDVYQSTGSSVVVLGLANGTTYHFKIFVLKGSTWSGGVAVSGTPNPVTGDYQARASGNWSSYTTWSIYNGTTWGNATSSTQYPQTKTVNVIIPNTYTVTLDNLTMASPYEINNLIVQSGGKLDCGTSSGTVLFVDIYGNITCTGTIGNSPSNDDIGINVDGVNCIIAGTGSCACSRIRKNNNDNATTNLTIETNISFLWATSASTQLYNNPNASNSNTNFNVIINAGYTVTCTNTGNVCIDGVDGTNNNTVGGSITVNGRLIIPGILYLTTDNSSTSYSSAVTINDGGEIDANQIIASASGNAKHTFTINSGGLLNITGTSAISSFSNTNNTYTLNPGSTVQYSASGAQTIETGMGAYSYLTCSGSGDKTLNSNITINGNLIVNAAIFDCPGSSTTMTIAGNITLQSGGTMSTHCYNNLRLTTSGASTQTFTGGTNSIQCYNLTSVTSSGGITLAGGSGQTTLNIGNNFSVDYTSTAVFTDNGNIIIVGNNAALGNASLGSTASNFSFTGTMKFICASSNSTLSDYTGNLICVAQLYNLTVDAASSSKILEIMPSPSGGQNLYVNGSVTIANTSESSNFNPNGNIINVGGNWTTYGHGGLQAIANGNSTIIFNGASGSSQTITSASGNDYEVFYNWQVNNATGVTLSSTVDVSNQLTLTNGVITTGANEVDVTNTATNAVTGHSAASYVAGNLQRSVAATGSYDFPAGTNSNYELTTLNLNSSSGISNMVASFTSGLPATLPNSTTCFINSTPIGSMLNGGYWTITPDNITTVNYDITLKETGYTNFTGSATELGVIKRHNSSSAWAGTNLAGGTSSTQGYHSNSTQSISSGVATAKRTSVQSFSDYGIGFGAYALPISLTAFDAIPNGNNVLLTWETESEYNNKYFAIERSGNAMDFTQIGQVAGQGTTTEANSYSFPDNNPLNGVSYYRLRQVDEDGTATYSQIRAVEFKTTNPSINIYPVPASSVLQVNGITEETTYKVYDISGRFIQNGIVMPDETGINITSLSAGVYLLVLNNEDMLFHQKFIKE